MNGPITACGTNAIIEAIDKTTGEPVEAVKCQMMLNCTIALVSREKICPLNIIKKVLFQFPGIDESAIISISFPKCYVMIAIRTPYAR
jgi:hypothetical protein